MKYSMQLVLLWKKSNRNSRYLHVSAEAPGKNSKLFVRIFEYYFFGSLCFVIWIEAVHYTFLR